MKNGAIVTKLLLILIQIMIPNQILQFFNRKDKQKVFRLLEFRLMNYGALLKTLSKSYTKEILF